MSSVQGIDVNNSPNARNRVLLVITNHDFAPYLTDTLAYPVESVLLDRPERCGAWKCFNGAIYSYGDITNKETRLQAVEPIDLERLETIQRNVHTGNILDRAAGFRGRMVDPFKSHFTYWQFVGEGWSKCRNLLTVEGIDKVVFTAIPHDIESWLLFHAAYAAGIEVVVIRQSPLPWRACAQSIIPCERYGYQVQRAILPPYSENVVSASRRAMEYVERKRGEYEGAEPSYMRAQRAQGGKTIGVRIRQAFSELRAYWGLSWLEVWARLYQRVFRRCYKSMLMSALKKVQRADLQARPKITLFLHYQPERTTVPEGGRFANPWVAIEFLKRIVPVGWTIVVKEHPSTFMMTPIRPFRHPELYRHYSEDDAVHFVSPEHDSFELMDSSECIATVTGTVGFEALCREVPVVVLGDALYKDAPGVLDFSCGRGCHGSFERELDAARQALSKNNILDYVRVIEAKTYFEWRSSENRDRISRETMTFACEEVCATSGTRMSG